MPSYHVEAGSVHAVDLTIRYRSERPWERFGRAREISTEELAGLQSIMRGESLKTWRRKQRQAEPHGWHVHISLGTDTPSPDPIARRRRMHQQYRRRHRYS